MQDRSLRAHFLGAPEFPVPTVMIPLDLATAEIACGLFHGICIFRRVLAWFALVAHFDSSL